jgi:hypothetical protein
VELVRGDTISAGPPQQIETLCAELFKHVGHCPTFVRAGTFVFD